MKVAIYSNLIDCGGISKFIYNLHNAFGKCDINSEIVTFKVETIYGNNINLLTCNNHLDRIKNLRKFIIDEEITSIVANTWFEGLIAKLSTIGVKRKVKVLSVVHIRPNLWGISEKDFVKKYIAKISLRLCDKVISVSEELESAMINEGWVNKKHITTIYNPVIFDECNNDYRDVLNKDIEKKETIQVAVIGWIKPIKAQDIIVKALNEYADDRVTVNFIGSVAKEDEKYYEQVNDLIEKYNLEDKIKMWGARNDIFKILENMDVLVSASRCEALPTVLIEALYKQVPIISSDCDYGPKEILDNGKYGMIFKTDDYKELSESLDILINNNEIYNNMLKQSKQRSYLFTYKKSVEKYLYELI